jgi:hypothetical protein
MNAGGGDHRYTYQGYDIHVSVEDSVDEAMAWLTINGSSWAAFLHPDGQGSLTTRWGVAGLEPGQNFGLTVAAKGHTHKATVEVEFARADENGYSAGRNAASQPIFMPTQEARAGFVYERARIDVEAADATYQTDGVDVKITTRQEQTFEHHTIELWINGSSTGHSSMTGTYHGRGAYEYDVQLGPSGECGTYEGAKESQANVPGSDVGREPLTETANPERKQLTVWRDTCDGGGQQHVVLATKPSDGAVLHVQSWAIPFTLDELNALA